MLFKNNKGEIKIINKLYFDNDKDYYNCIKNFMDVTNENISYNESINNLLESIKILI